VHPTRRPLIPHGIQAIVAAGLLAGLIGACSASGSASPSPAPSGGPGASPSGMAILHPTGAAELVLKYAEVGGFAGPRADLGRYPSIAVYGDGSVITQGPVPAIFPGPALPNLIVTKLTEAGLQKLLAAAAAAGLLGPDAQYDATGIADATSADFTVVAAGSKHHISAYALGFSDLTMEGGATNVAARSRLRAFTRVLGDLRQSLGADALGSDAPYVYGSLRVLAAPGAPQPGDPALARPPLAWPLSTPLATFGAPGTGVATGFRCGVVTGADLESLRPLLARATSITGWRSGGSDYTLMLLPMLPDDPGC
jgi:hypothetical protein